MDNADNSGSSSESSFPIFSLPPHVIANIYEYFDLQTVNSMRLVSRAAYHTISQNSKHLQKPRITRIGIDKKENCFHLSVTRCSICRPRKTWNCIITSEQSSGDYQEEEGCTTDIPTFYKDHGMSGIKWCAATKETIIRCGNPMDELRRHLEFLFERASVEHMCLYGLDFPEIKMLTETIQSLRNMRSPQTNIELFDCVLMPNEGEIITRLVRLCEPQTLSINSRDVSWIPSSIFDLKLLSRTNYMEVTQHVVTPESPFLLLDDEILAHIMGVNRLSLLIHARHLVTLEGIKRLLKHHVGNGCSLELSINMDEFTKEDFLKIVPSKGVTLVEDDDICDVSWKIAEFGDTGCCSLRTNYKSINFRIPFIHEQMFHGDFLTDDSSEEDIRQEYESSSDFTESEYGY